MAIQTRELARRLLRHSSALITNAATGSVPRRGYVSAPDAAASSGFFRRILQRRTINQAAFAPARIPQFMALPLGEDLREKLRETGFAGVERRDWPAVLGGAGVTTAESVKRIARLAQVEAVKERLRSAAESAVAYSEYLRICVDACKSPSLGLEMAKLLDDSANVVVWGNVVFLHPQQLVKSVETLLFQSAALPNDPRKNELNEMEREKAQIDRQAQLLVKRELYFGLALMMAQTAGFMRLTFWELSWDVMEPVCFFAASLHCALGYTFFLCTATEPSYEGYFKRRFKAKQAKLIRERGFDLAKYESLRKAVYPPTLRGGVGEGGADVVSK